MHAAQLTQPEPGLLPFMAAAPAVPEVTLLSYGGGQDSWTILVKLARDAAFRRRYAPGRLVVAMSDTGKEHDATYLHVQRTRAFCEAAGIEFHFLRPDDPAYTYQAPPAKQGAPRVTRRGFHSDAWRSLDEQYDRNTVIGSAAYPKTCTDNLKIQVVDRFMDLWWLPLHYGVGLAADGHPAGRKAGYKAFAARHGRVRVLIGIARGEESRVADPDKGQAWRRQTIEIVYPLLQEGMDRADCQQYLRAEGVPVPPPSNCETCPFMSGPELLWLVRTKPATFWEWRRREKAKIDRCREEGVPDETNFGVYGRKTLVGALTDAVRKFGHMTDAELHEYKMSHGHCVASKY